MPTRPITRAQRIALKSVFDRMPLMSRQTSHGQYDRQCTNRDAAVIDHFTLPDYVPMTYRAFRRTVQGPLSLSTPYIMVPWCGMWVGIETDGFTHC